MIEVFARLFGTDQLVCSLDRINFKFPGRPYVSKGPWCHADQHPSGTERQTIQAYLTLSAQRDESPANRFYAGSHRVFGDFFASQKGEGSLSDWTLLSDEQRERLRGPLSAG